jgi:hypothetical protein
MFHTFFFFFSRKSCHLRDNVKKYGTGLLMTRWWRFTCWISNTTPAKEHALAPASTLTHARARARTHTQRNIKYLLLFYGNIGFLNVPQCYDIQGGSNMTGTICM